MRIALRESRPSRRISRSCRRRPILTGYLEFQDTLGKNLSEAYVGQLPAKDVLKKTEDEWNAIVRRIGRTKLKEELASYKAVMPKRDKPA